MLKGSGMHKGAEVNFRQKIESHEDLPMEQIIDAAVAGFDAELERSDVALTADEQSLGRDVAIGLARDEVKSLAAAFAVFQAPYYQPIEVERRFRIPVPRGTHDVLGVIDLIAEVNNQAGRRIVDFKTGKRKKSAATAAESLQLTTYAAGHMVEFGEPPADVRLDVLILKSGKKTAGQVERQELVQQRGQADFVVLANKLNAMDKAVKEGVFLPAAEGAWNCSEKFCPFFKSCGYVNPNRNDSAQEE